jgi:LemA protein
MGLGFEIVVLVGLSLIIIVLAQWYTTRYNALIRLKNDVVKAWSNIDVLLKQRNDEIPNLVSVVKAYMEYEKQVLEEVTKARMTFLNATSLQEKLAADHLTTSALEQLFAVAENYPNLKANENFLKLQSRITGLENEIADRRELFNEAVNILNIRVESVPDMYIAKPMGLKRVQMFRMKTRA